MRPLRFLPLLFAPGLLFAQATTSQLQSGQELIYRGHFGAAQVYFADLSQQFPRDPAAPILEATALVWWAEAKGDVSYEADRVDSLLARALVLAQAGADSAVGDAARSAKLFWLGTAHGIRARQADARGNTWRAAREARAMQGTLERAVALDSSCVDCLVGLGAYDWALARASALARLVARIVGLGGGDATRGLARIRRTAEDGALMRTEARWVYATALLRDGERDAALHEEAIRRIGDLVAQFPDNPVFRRALPAGAP